MYCPILRQPPITQQHPQRPRPYYANDDDNKNNNLVLEFMNIAVCRCSERSSDHNVRLLVVYRAKCHRSS